MSRLRFLLDANHADFLLLTDPDNPDDLSKSLNDYVERLHDSGKHDKELLSALETISEQGNAFCLRHEVPDGDKIWTLDSTRIVTAQALKRVIKWKADAGKYIFETLEKEKSE